MAVKNFLCLFLCRLGLWLIFEAIFHWLCAAVSTHCGSSLYLYIRHCPKLVKYVFFSSWRQRRSKQDFRDHHNQRGYLKVAWLRGLGQLSQEPNLALRSGVLVPRQKGRGGEPQNRKEKQITLQSDNNLLKASTSFRTEKELSEVILSKEYSKSYRKF